MNRPQASDHPEILAKWRAANRSAPRAVNEHKMHYTYIVPSDRTDAALVANNAMAIHRAASHQQVWLQSQMGNYKTWTLNFPVLTIGYSKHPAEYFHGDGDTWSFWLAVLDESYALFGSGWGQGVASWVNYIDQNPLENQGAGGTGDRNGGMAVLGRDDLDSLRGVSTKWTQCRGIGGGLHEAMHTLGRPHPVNVPPEIWEIAIMGVGYYTYPNAILTDDDKADFNKEHPFFTALPVLRAPKGLCPFKGDGNRPQPVPRPHPKPQPRPPKP
jgi:hypothetical protein